jgi:hypothetical protein
MRNQKVVFAVIGVLVLVTALVFGFQSKGRNNIFRTPSAAVGRAAYFQPKHHLLGIGSDRVSMDGAAISLRTKSLIAAQTFGIMRNSDGKKLDAAVWADRVTAPEMQDIIAGASRTSGFPAPLIEGIVFIESGGDENAKSPTGPRGIMQMTARIGNYLHLRHKVETKAQVVIKARGSRNHAAHKGQSRIKSIVKTLKRIVVVDDRGDASRAIPAGAKLLAETAQYYHQKYNLPEDVAQQFAVWEWHSGRPVVDKALKLAKQGGIKDITLPQLFFLNSPGHNPELFALLQRDLDQDYGPTYWFRVMRAEQLLNLYRVNRVEYKELMDRNRSTVPGAEKAESRLETWYSLDGSYQSVTDLKAAIASGKLVRPPSDPAYFSYALRMDGPAGIGSQDPANRELYATDPPAVIGALLYVASETRRAWEQSPHPVGEQFVPLEVTSMVRTAQYQKLLNRVNGNSRTTFPSHTLGAVDVSFAKLSRSEETALHFVLEDLGFEEDIGYFNEHKAQKTMHFMPSPKQASFFREIYDEATTSSKK